MTSVTTRLALAKSKEQRAKRLDLPIMCSVLLTILLTTGSMFGQHPITKVPNATQPAGAGSLTNEPPSIWVWEIEAANSSSTVLPGIGLQLNYDLNNAPGSISAGAVLGTSYWGISTADGNTGMIPDKAQRTLTNIGTPYTQDATPNRDVVLNAAHARDLIITNLTATGSSTDYSYGAIRFGTTPAGATLPNSGTIAADLERMTILNNGYVGIGTPTPKDVLHLHKAALQISNEDGGGQLLTIGQLCVAPSNGSYSSVARKGDVVFRMFNYDSSTTSNDHDIIFSAHTNLGGFRFTTGNRTDVERLTIFHDGNVIVNGPSATVTNMGFSFGVNGSMAAIFPATGKASALTLQSENSGAWWNVANIADGEKFVIGEGDMRTANNGSDWNDVTGLSITHSTHNVGIATVDPQDRLHVSNGALRVSNINGGTAINTIGQLAVAPSNGEYSNIAVTGDVVLRATNASGSGSNSNGVIVSAHTSGGSIRFSTGSSDAERMRILSNGTVLIGATGEPTDQSSGYYKLAVKGKMKVQEVRVSTSNWPDYVFADDYRLMPLDTLSKFIEKNKRLPDVPAASEAETNGVQLGEMQGKLLRKVEELTLYVLELKKENEALKLAIESLKKQDN